MFHNPTVCLTPTTHARTLPPTPKKGQVLRARTHDQGMLVNVPPMSTTTRTLA